MSARAVLVGGGVALACDAVFAGIACVFVLRALSIPVGLRYFASGLLGRDAFAG